MEQPTASSMDMLISLRVGSRITQCLDCGHDLDMRAWASSLGSVCLLQQLRLPADRQVPSGNWLLLLIRGW